MDTYGHMLDLSGYQKLLGREPAEQDHIAEYVFIATRLETSDILGHLGASSCWIPLHDQPMTSI